MEQENWGIGSKKDEKPFDTVLVGSDHKKEMDLVFGEHPHSRQDNTIYARDKDGTIIDFDGHRLPFKIVIEEFNYLKESELSGDQIRKGGSVKVFVGDIQIFDEFTRNYESGYRKAQHFIDSMEMNWSWFPRKTKEQLGRIVGYKEQLFKIDSFIIDQGCMILKTLDGKPRKKFLYEEEEDYEPEDSLKVEINCEDITWYPAGYNK